jgi:hypothetical protein
MCVGISYLRCLSFIIIIPVGVSELSTTALLVILHKSLEDVRVLDILLPILLRSLRGCQPDAESLLIESADTRGIRTVTVVVTFKVLHIL